MATGTAKPKMAAGTEVYKTDSGAVVARGHSHTDIERDAALDGPVRALIEDEASKRRAIEATESLALTDFNRTNLDEILNAQAPLEDWRVGEAYGECYFDSHKECTFPWPDKWDERTSGSSLPGADYLGFQKTSKPTLEYRFAFGEAKTSFEDKYPPGTMHGRTGLKAQLETLRDNKLVRDNLFRYLMVRAPKATWKPMFDSAAKRYLNDSNDVSIFGVLVRDVKADALDLSARAKALAKGHPASMHIELLGIYLPNGSIQKFAAYYTKPNSTKKGGQNVSN
jgi:hypothetical protein